MGKILDKLLMSLGKTQHEQIWHQWLNSVPQSNHLYFERTATECPKKNGRVQKQNLQA